MADRIGIIHKGEIILVEDKAKLMDKLGKRQLTLHLQSPLERIPVDLTQYPLELSVDGSQLTYTFSTRGELTEISDLFQRLAQHGIGFKDLESSQSSLEDIFVNLVSERV
jgi:ABC-2 type transport system ATP-binding protein